MTPFHESDKEKRRCQSNRRQKCGKRLVSNTLDSISNELAQKRQEITKRIIDNQRGIPKTPYTSATDPEDRFHHLFDYIEKAKSAYQIRQEIEKETQTLKNENHGNNSLTPQGTQAQRVDNHIPSIRIPAQPNNYHVPKTPQAQLNNYHEPIGSKGLSNNHHLQMATQTPINVQTQSNNFLVPAGTETQSNNFEQTGTRGPSKLVPIRTTPQSNNYNLQMRTQSPINAQTQSNNFLVPAGTEAQTNSIGQTATRGPSKFVPIITTPQSNNYNLSIRAQQTNENVPIGSQTQSINSEVTPRRLQGQTSISPAQPQPIPLPTSTSSHRKTWAPRMDTLPQVQSSLRSSISTQSPLTTNMYKGFSTASNGNSVDQNKQMQGASVRTGARNYLKGTPAKASIVNGALAPTPYTLTGTPLQHQQLPFPQSREQRVRNDNALENIQNRNQSSIKMPDNTFSQFITNEPNILRKPMITGSVGVKSQIIGRPIPGQSQSDSKIADSKAFQGGFEDAPQQRIPFYRKSFVPVVAKSVNVTVVQNVSGLQHHNDGRGILPDLNIPLYDKTFLPIVPDGAPGKYEDKAILTPHPTPWTQQNAVTQQSPVTQQNAVTHSPITQQNVVTQQISVTQQNAGTHSPITQQNVVTQQISVTQQNAGTHSPITHQNVVTQQSHSAIAQHSSVMQQSEATQQIPVTQQRAAIQNSAVMQQSLIRQQSAVTQQIPVTQQRAVTQHSPVTQQSDKEYITDARRTDQQGPKNILQLLNKGLNKDLSNLDVRAHLRPHRDAALEAKQYSEKLNTSIQRDNSSTSKSNITTKIDKTDINRTASDADTSDIGNHIQPIVMSGATVLSSITSLLEKQNKHYAANLLQKPDTSIGESRHNTTRKLSLKNETGLPLVKQQFQNWLTRKSEGKDVSMELSSPLDAKETMATKNNTLTASSSYEKTINTSNSKMEPLNIVKTAPSTNQTHQLKFLKNIQNAPRPNFQNNPLNTTNVVAGSTTEKNKKSGVPCAILKGNHAFTSERYNR
ncbi:hypothetical protein AC249_AIPGENE17424 [Exaiptasia diaphana]|nr:hypothetical protein AC249_AIPGENE17424 [Exaiptasia diaphana]